MKKLFFVPKTLLITGLIALSLVSCKDAAKPEDTKEAAEEKNETRFDTIDSKEDDADLLVDIAEMNLAEISAAKLAKEKAINTDVKRYAEILVNDHTKSGMELKSLADSKQIALPTSITDKGKDEYKDLNEKTGLDFDKEFINKMIDNHEKTIKKLENASTDNDKDQNVKTWASNKIASLTSHLQQAKMIKEKLDKM